MPSPVNISPLACPLLFHAEQAVRHVKSVIYVAGNRLLDAAATVGGSFVCVSAQRFFNPDDQSLPKLERIHRWAAAAQQSHCGNCGEQTAVAFTFLERDRILRPLDFMYFKPPFDHNYVVIGRIAGSNESDVSTWGKNAVVCDPWSNKAYPAADLAKHWPGRIPASFFRL